MSHTWVPVPEGSTFGIQNLPYGVFSRRGELPRIGVAIGTYVLDLAGLATAQLIDDRRWFAAGSLNAFMAAGRPAWEANRARLTELLTDEAARPEVQPHLIPQNEVGLHMPIEVADYVDFYASRAHATNIGRIFRPTMEPLLSNWLHLPVGYHGRAGTVVVSETPIIRPCGQRKLPGDTLPSFGPSTKLDIEAELGFIVGVPSSPGQPVETQAFRDHVFGFVLVNDWSARDVQQWEAQPLGPFLSKSFATSISPWVTPTAALEAARVNPPTQDPVPLPYLRCDEPWGLDITIEIELNGQVIARPPVSGMYWTPPQQLAHTTINGAPLRTGDLLASGTVSGPEKEQYGSLIELSWNGEEPIELPDGTKRVFLEDGDTVRLRATAAGTGHIPIGLGEVTGTIFPAVC